MLWLSCDLVLWLADVLMTLFLGSANLIMGFDWLQPLLNLFWLFQGWGLFSKPVFCIAINCYRQLSCNIPPGFTKIDCLINFYSFCVCSWGMCSGRCSAAVSWSLSRWCWANSSSSSLIVSLIMVDLYPEEQFMLMK